MTMTLSSPSMISNLATGRREGSCSARVALLCDFLEERWASMDLVGESLFLQLTADHGNDVLVTRMLPTFHWRFNRLSVLPGGLATNLDRFINRFVDYPAYVRTHRSDYDIFHVIDHSYSQLLWSLPASRTVVTCHDLDTFRCVLEPERDPRSPWFRAMTRRILSGFRRAAHVIAVSDSTREELLTHGLFPPDRISVVSNGVHPSCSPKPDRIADDSTTELLQNSSNETIWLLSVGTTIPRKRIDVLLRVFAAVLKESPQVRLLRVGGSFTPEQLKLVSDLKIGHAIVVLPFLERDVLAAVYRRATLLLHTAEAEGFGLPLIEAMACGCPVLASDLPVLREVGAEACTYGRVADVDHWKGQVLELLREKKQTEEGWERRRQRGIAHAALYSWTENARQTARIYRMLMRN
jgi:glycosyltransferase involved in cell wall biosynthesis